ncbi:MAG: hypothetical protein HETSPECPRED_003508 [Heterodermia speciosa]|uniref:Ras-GAP domain-containing protein n=1 Tax=Heterodermia speciosa TaxID=116794 RepID=A0A8H3F325_9LECA|nr:MAG: hypothetical protein HETSPECPRED_003508 [Heterodermia speciosa]
MEGRTESKQRSSHKRLSGIQERNGQPVERRTSKKKPSQDRRGQVYPDEITVRALTPNPPTRNTAEKRLSGLELFPPTRTDSPQLTGRRTPHPVSRDSPPHSQPHGRAPSSDGEKHTHSRPRTRTLEERFRENASPSLISKTRQRIGSLHSPTFENTPSIGFPSVMPSPPLESQVQGDRRKIIKPHSRQLSPVRNPSAKNRRQASQASSTDASKILQLMKITCGRMHGILSFRTSVVGTWSSGYCAINVASGSLIYQKQGDVSHAKTLIHDLRGCQVRTLYDAESHSTFLDVATRFSTTGIHLRPRVPETFDSWLAALLCWQPIRPKGLQNKMTKPQTPLMSGPRPSPASERRLGDRRRNSEIIQTKGAAIIKVGKVLLWEKDHRSGKSTPVSPQRSSLYKEEISVSTSWRKVSCTLQENGHFKLYTESDVTLVAVVPLSSLSRCAVQRLDPSILDDDFSLAIYPQYTSQTSVTPAVNAIYLSMESRVLFEVWFVLLRAFTIPELYGPEQISVDPYLGPFESTSVTSRSSSATDMFRVERLLSVRVIEAKMYQQAKSHGRGPPANARSRPGSKNDSTAGSYFAEISIDGDVRGKTQLKQETSNPFWREDFEIVDLPAVISMASIEIKTRNSSHRDWTLVAHSPYNIEHENINPLSVVGDIEVSPLDLSYGKVELRFDELERGTDTEKWWPIVNEHGENVGDLLMKIRIDELVVLMGRDYQPLSELLHTFSTGLTNQIAQALHSELKRLSETLLNVFQVSAQASDWIMSLVEDEIDNIHKETPVTKFRYGRRIASNDSHENGIDREMFVRDLGKSATSEANLLFRGNTLLTKALDLHMQRLGKEYLEDALSEKMRDIDESDPDCEVDPNKVQNSQDLERNWRNLVAHTENIWKSIAASATRCPPELRMIFRHIRACAEDRYGNFLRSVTYSSVSGFLFLRFFVPAVLNPKLFGLLKNHPRLRAQRTLTLIAKSLQTLANLSTFGSKEPWMEPMNVFLTTHRQEFKDFVDTICDISPDRATSAIPPSYATPITILGRLPDTSREGFPSLPYLIDQARECAGLVETWLNARHEIDHNPPWSDELRKFDALCEHLRQRTKDCLACAEQAERPSGTMEPKWEELVEQMDRKARLREEAGYSSPGTPSMRTTTKTVNSSTSSFGDGYFSRGVKMRTSPSPTYGVTVQSRITNDAVRSRDEIDEDSEGEETDTPPGSSSAVWDPGVGHRRPSATQTYNGIQQHKSDDLNHNFSLGSSSFGLDTSNRAHAGSTEPVSPLSGPEDSPMGPMGKSLYSLDAPVNAPSTKTSKHLTKTPRSKAGSRDGPNSGRRHRHEPRQKSMYRLPSNSSSHLADAMISPRSASSRDGGGQGKTLFGDFGAVFRKRAKERERDPR